jgi:hypothetical protein
MHQQFPYQSYNAAQTGYWIQKFDKSYRQTQQPEIHAPKLLECLKNINSLSTSASWHMSGDSQSDREEVLLSSMIKSHDIGFLNNFNFQYILLYFSLIGNRVFHSFL